MKIVYKQKSVKQLKKVDNNNNKIIREKINNLTSSISLKEVKDIKVLKNSKYDYRLRVGNYRILINYDKKDKLIIIEEIKKRDERTY